MLAAGWGGWLPLESGKLRAPGGDGHLTARRPTGKRKDPRGYPRVFFVP